MLFLAVTLHNIPEGMAVGMAFAVVAQGSESAGVTMLSAIALAVGIGIQNFPEGAAIALPLRQENISRKKAFFYGALSGSSDQTDAATITPPANPIKPLSSDCFICRPSKKTIAAPRRVINHGD